MAVWQNIIIQLGISALIVFVVYKIALLVIEKWAKAEEVRTAVIAEGFRSITQSHASVLETINEHQIGELNVLASMRIEISRLHGAVAQKLDLTPVHGVPFIHPGEEPTDMSPPIEPPKPRTGTGNNVLRIPGQSGTGPFPRAESPRPTSEWGPHKPAGGRDQIPGGVSTGKKPRQG